MKPLIIRCRRFFNTFGLPIVAVILILLKGQSTEYPATCDESEFDNIGDHAGWVIKRVRDTLVKGKDELPAMESENDSTVVQGSKVEALNLISNLGEGCQAK